MAPISFARGAPSLDIVAVDDLRAAADRAFQNDPAGTFSYGTSGGYVPLRDWIAEQHGKERENVIVTNGSMQADAFLFQQLVQPGDTVVVEAPTYDRTLLSLRGLGADILAIPLEPDGTDVEALARALEAGARPKLAHIIPNFQNPAGTPSRWRSAVVCSSWPATTASSCSRTTRTSSSASKASGCRPCCRSTPATASCTRPRSRRRCAPASGSATCAGPPS